MIKKLHKEIKEILESDVSLGVMFMMFFLGLFFGWGIWRC